jgi:exodeoxyribonuclease V alpha subunit
VQLAYALTAHKAQGSEFPCAVVLCHRSHFFARPQLAVHGSDARGAHCVLLGDRWGLRNARAEEPRHQPPDLLDRWARAVGLSAIPLEVACAG